MAKVYVDTNYFIGLVNRTPETDVDILNKHYGYVSVLSCHILFYINKELVPNIKLNKYINQFHTVGLPENLLKTALEGPTVDLEDNIQLHSASKSDCDYFLTFDKKLLKMKFFGKMRIVSTI